MHHAHAFLKEELIFYDYHIYRDGEGCIKVHSDLKNHNVSLLFTLTPSCINASLMELFLLLEALRGLGVVLKDLILPYMGYARSPYGEGASLMAQTIQRSTEKITTFCLHEKSIERAYQQCIFNHVTALDLFAQDIKKRFRDNLVLIAPDEGAAELCNSISAYLKCSCLSIKKVRSDLKVISKMAGEDMRGKVCILIDDMIDSGETLKGAIDCLIENGADQIHAYVAHVLFKEMVQAVLQSHPIFSLTVCNSIAHHFDDPRIRVLDILKVLFLPRHDVCN